MSPLAVFGITSDGLNLVVNLLLLFLVVFWFALVYWTFSDARRRIADPMLVGCATAASLFPFAGTLVYMIVRPPEYLEDVRERELEIAAAEVRLAAIENLSCAYCNFEIERSFLRCPNCLRRLKEPCATCSKPLDPTWKICPYCESEIGQAAPQPRRRARPRERPAAAAPAQPQALPPADGQRRAPAPQRTPATQRAVSGEPQRRAPAPAPAGGGQRRAAPARPAPAPAGDGQRRAAPARTEGQRGAATPPGGAQRAPGGDLPARSNSQKADRQPTRDGRSARPAPEPSAARGGGESQPASSPNRQKRSGAAATKRPASGSNSDAVTAEQPAARPRTRPPSAG